MHDWRDKLEIEELQRRFAIAVDAKNFDEIRRLFTADGVVRFHGDLDVDHFVGIFAETQKVVDTHHLSLNSVAVIDKNKAVSTNYWWAYHRVPALATDEMIRQIYGHHPVETDLFQGGTYNDELVRTTEGWRFKVRSVAVLWSQTAPSQPRFQQEWTKPIIFATLTGVEVEQSSSGQRDPAPS